MSFESDMELIDAYREVNVSIDMMKVASGPEARDAIHSHIRTEVAKIRAHDPDYADTLAHKAIEIDADRRRSERLMQTCIYVRLEEGADGEIAYLRARVEAWRIDGTHPNGETFTLPVRDFFDLNEGLSATSVLAISKLRPGESTTYTDGRKPRTVTRRQ